MNRTCGIILHPTSLPSRYGIGDLGPTAYTFIDALVEAHQHLWEILPLGHTSYGNSPYMTFTAFGGNPYLLSPELLQADGWLTKKDLTSPSLPDDHVDYKRIIPYKEQLLHIAFQRFKNKIPDAFHTFCQQHAGWLDDYATFIALKKIHNNEPWTCWESSLAEHTPKAVKESVKNLQDEILFWKFSQFQFFQQWERLRSYCHRNHVLIIGDIPIYVAHDSADVWAHQDLFKLDRKGRPLVVAGVPPDYFSSTGQRWGNPIYQWDRLKDQGFKWWIERFRLNFSLVDILRLDHFRGFEAYWEIPVAEHTAERGRWVPGPGASLFQSVIKALGPINVIAEDLGVITPEVDALRERLGFPGMRILQMAFGTDPKASEYRPCNFIHHCVVYTATHDHNTTVGWFTSPPGEQTTQTRDEVAAERETVLCYLGTDGRKINWDFIRLAQGSVAEMAIYPMQDVLGLGSDARMNLPGTHEGNWEWRFSPGQFSEEHKSMLRRLTEVFERDGEVVV